MTYFVIDASHKLEIIVEKSRFIAYVRPITTDLEFRVFKRYVEADAPNASHYPFAYRLSSTSKASDDGEPKGTVGKPLLELLTRLELAQLAVIVVRYFGGTKLGAGRLLRTYLDVANQALSQLPRFRIISSTIYQVTLKNSEASAFEYLLRTDEVEVLSKTFDDHLVTMTLNAADDIEIIKKVPYPLTPLRSSIIYRKEDKYATTNHQRTSESTK